jgi:glycosyltransferase involved in cell wall biosynthesis
MRIAIGLHSPQLGGSQIATIDLARRLRCRGHHVEMFVIDQTFKTSALPLAEKAGFSVEILPAESTLLKQAARIRSFVTKHDSQVVHVYHEHHWLGALVALAVRPLAGRSAVVTNWMMENHRWIPPYVPLIVGFESLQDEAQALQRAPVWLIEPPVDTDSDRLDAAAGAAFRVEMDLAQDLVLAVMATRVDRAMKLDSILRSIAAVEALAATELRLVIVGDGDAMDVVEARATEANSTLGYRAVRLVGALHDPRPAYSAADLVLGMGGSAIRALAFGKPVIVQGEGSFSKTFDDTSLDYFLRHGFYGRADRETPVDLLTGQISAMLDPERRAELGEYGLQVVRERFSLEVMTSRLEEVYRSAIANPPSVWKRHADAAYVYGYDLSHRILPAGLKHAVRRRIARLRAT